MKLVWNKFPSVCWVSVIMKMKFLSMATSSLVLQRNSGLLHSYLTDGPKRSQNKMGVSVNSKSESIRQTEKHGKIYVKLLDGSHVE